MPSIRSVTCVPHTLSADESNGGAGVEVRFIREIVWPDGRREVEGVTPKALPAPDTSHVLPISGEPITRQSKMNNLDD